MIQPENKPPPIFKILITLACIVFVLAVTGFLCRACERSPQQQPTAPADSPSEVEDSESKRRQFADGLRQMALESAEAAEENPEYDAVDRTLRIISNNMDSRLCRTFAQSTMGSAAATVGFGVVECINRRTHAKYQFYVTK